MRAGYDNHPALLASRFALDLEDLNIEEVLPLLPAYADLDFTDVDPAVLHVEAVTPGEDGNDIRIRTVVPGGTCASLTTNFVLGSFISTALAPGPDGNFITLTIVDPAGADPGGVVVAGTDITVTLAHDGGAITSTIGDVALALNTDPAASLLILVSDIVSPLELANGVAVANLAGGTFDIPFSISVVGTDIDVSLERAGIAVITDLDTLALELNTDPAASALIIATVISGGAELCQDTAWTALTGGQERVGLGEARLGSLPKGAIPVGLIFNGQANTDAGTFAAIIVALESIFSTLAIIYDLNTEGDTAFGASGDVYGYELTEDSPISVHYFEEGAAATVGGPWYFTLYYTWGGN